MMDTTEILTELRQQRDRLNEAIIVLERLASGGHRRRGRPPKWMTAQLNGTSSRKRKPFTAATRKKMAASQKRRWAEIRKADAKA
jgi:hypothetical protein